jgi:hypothetical protein
MTSEEGSFKAHLFILIVGMSADASSREGKE